MAFKIPEYTVNVDQLQPGVFIKLKSTWFNHPFLFTKFKIKSTDQIRTLKELGVTEVICVPEKSDMLPKSPAEIAPAKSEPNRQESSKAPQPDPATEKMWKIKKERIELLKQKRMSIARTEERYRTTIKQVPQLMHDVIAGSADALKEADGMVMGMVDSFLADTDAVVHLMDAKADEGLFNHSLNVTVLALMLGKTAVLAQEEMHVLGLGALLHDIGKNRIEKKILRKPPPLSKPEQELFNLHPRYGAEMVARLADFPPESVRVVLQHHERMDGKGYPDGAKVEKISRLARITAIADTYDSLCNNIDPAKSLTPYQALSFMFTKCKASLDMQIFSLFIRCLGIYPPGTVVVLSNEVIGLVISINPTNPLKPSILLYDPEVPKEEAIIFGLDEDPELSIVKSIPPHQLPKEIFTYLNPRLRVSYFMDDPSQAGGSR